MLNRQINLYSLDTACFYNENENRIQRKLLRLYNLRKLKNECIENLEKNKNVKYDIELENVNELKVVDELEKDIEDYKSELVVLSSENDLKYNNKKNIEYEDNEKAIRYYNWQIRIINKALKFWKNELENEFEITRKYNKENNKIRELDSSNLVERNIVSIFESNLTRALKIEKDELTEKLMIVQVYFFQVAEDLIRNGFMYNGEKYVMFSASAGQIRTKKFVVIRENDLKEIENNLMCGITREDINKRGGINTNKFLAYYALNNTASDVLDDFDIDKSIVVDDFETFVNGKVDYIDDTKYTVVRKYMDCLIPHTDGCGLMLSGKNMMIRLPWVKGLMGVFDYKKFILEKRKELNDETIGIIKDIYGKEYDILKDDIQYIFTKSQFKLHNMYDSWDDYKTKFKDNNCDACCCNIELEESQMYDGKLNYQMLQTITDITDDEFEHLISKTNTEISKVGDDFKTINKILGVNIDESEVNEFTPLQKSIKIYPEIIRDKYTRQMLKDKKASMVKKAKAGKLLLDSKYTFILPDLYAFCEWLFLGIKIPNGLLDNGEVFCWLFKDYNKVDCLRSPHLYMEHAVRKNKAWKTKSDSQELRKWFTTNALYVSTKDLISRILQFDVDGDSALVVADKLFVSIAERNSKKVVPLYYDAKKAKPSLLTNESLYYGIKRAYTITPIGVYSNNISKIWNSDRLLNGSYIQKENCWKAIKLLCAENNLVIDSAKTLYTPERPQWFKDEIHDLINTNLPYYFVYAKDKDITQVNAPNNSITNRLDNSIVNSRLKFSKTLNKFDYKMLLHNISVADIEELNQDIINAYNYYGNTSYIHDVSKKSLEIDDYKIKKIELYVYKLIRDRIFDLPYDRNYIIDTLIVELYRNRNTAYKKVLWECFGNYIYENIKKNVNELGNVCTECGRRFYPNSNSQKICQRCICTNVKRDNCIFGVK